jgi:predicted kinase
MRYRDRQAAQELARASAARLRIIECTAPDHIIRSRLEARQLRKAEPSDGRWEIYCEQKTQFEPIQLDERAHHRAWDSTTDLNMFLRSFVRELMCS